MAAPTVVLNARSLSHNRRSSVQQRSASVAQSCGAIARPAHGYAPPLARPARASSRNERFTIVDQRCSNRRPSREKCAPCVVQQQRINYAGLGQRCAASAQTRRDGKLLTGARVGGTVWIDPVRDLGVDRLRDGSSCSVEFAVRWQDSKLVRAVGSVFLSPCNLLRYRQSGPRPEPRLLRQPALEALTNSARTDSPRKTRPERFPAKRRRAAHGGGVSTCVTLNGSGIQLAVGQQPLRLRNHNSGLAQRIMVKRLATSPHDPLGITDSACKNQSVVVSVQYGPFNPYIPIRSTTIGKSRVAIDPIAMHTSWRSNSDIASATRVSMTFRVVRTNHYNQDLGLILSTNGNHLESSNEGSSIDHQVTIYLHAQNITMFATNETWYFASQILVSNSGGLILILTAQLTRNMFRIHSDY
ncbi:exportin 1 [Dorcoceras hygrometricum]|uniref:Exportin 1 n=1 Tax=Dorcoceras hygrometricum TaxID=472368 RepID=A0A2Z7BHL5_9LAMI|nr:exportin 1 [Dorcoceras hygrometricum]